MKKNNKKVKILNIPRIIVFVLVIYIVVSFISFIFKERVNHIEVYNTNYYKDVDIIRMANLQDYPSFLSVNLNSVKNTLESDPLISSAKVKYGWNFTIRIEIEENSPMFILKSNNNVVLKDGTQISYDESFDYLPTLLNNTPTDAYVTLANNLNKVDKGILHLISEITYSPYNSSGTILDDSRFLLSMSDSNQVYINAKSADNLNSYLDIIATEKLKEPGTFFMDGTLNTYTYKIATTTVTTTTVTTTVKEDNNG